MVDEFKLPESPIWLVVGYRFDGWRQTLTRCYKIEGGSRDSVAGTTHPCALPHPWGDGARGGEARIRGASDGRRGNGRARGGSDRQPSWQQRKSFDADGEKVRG